MEEEKTEEKPEEKVEEEEKKKPEVILDAEAAAEKLKEQNDRQEALIQRHEEIMAKQSLEGQSDAGAVPQPKKRLTDAEYAEALNKGEVDPFKEDGYI